MKKEYDVLNKLSPAAGKGKVKKKEKSKKYSVLNKLKAITDGKGGKTLQSMAKKRRGR